MPLGTTIVIDLGKTLSKISLWDASGHMLDRHVRSNARVEVSGIRRLDVEGIADWLIETLPSFAGHPVETIIPVGHGAGIVALDRGRLVFPPLDYEQNPPDDVISAYKAQRDPFQETGSPALPGGLNLGAQLFWLEQLYPGAMAGATLLPWAQYWSWFLTGQAVSEITSLGCHSDLWCPREADFSRMAHRLGWARKFAPLASAHDTTGLLKPDLAIAAGLSSNVRVLAGMHDSNAALLAARGFPEIADYESTVLSTGTWFIAMRRPAADADALAIPEKRDCLLNVDPFGKAIPSSRFMGGREIEELIEIDTRRVDIRPDQPALLAAVPEVLRQNRFALPTLAPGFGPYPDSQFRWVNRPDDWFECRAVACLYAALVADASLDLIGAQQRLLVEGRFADAEVFVRALASLRPQMAIYTANAHNDVSFGALRLVNPELKPLGKLRLIEPLPIDLTPYKAQWLAQIEAPA